MCPLDSTPKIWGTELFQLIVLCKDADPAIEDALKGGVVAALGLPDIQRRRADMLTRLLQAIAITSAVYLTMITYSSGSQSAVLVSSHYSAVRVDRLTHLLAEMLDVLLAPSQRGAARHRANATLD